MAFKRGDFTTGNAFYWSDTDLTIYAGNDNGPTPYSILLTDAAGKTARGFIGAVGAGETATGEIVTNGNMELDSSWANFGTAATNERSNVQAHGGTYSRHLITSAGNSGIKQSLSVTTGRLYKYSLWIYPITGAGYSSYHYRAGSTFGTGNITLSLNSWQNVIAYGTAYSTGAGDVNIYGQDNPNEFYVDDVSALQVTVPPSTGVHIVSASGGSVRAWASVDSGFNPNTITTAVVTPAGLGGGGAGGGTKITMDMGL